ncbi:MAG: YfhO family protein, partial [Lachnospiraceae bacterium]|nr:YfhO family protein [Lachnospiraceae bacterium]
ILVFQAAFCVNVINFILHVFRYPNSLPARFSFIYVFMILCICFRSIYKTKSIDKTNLIKSFFISIFFVLLLQKVVVNETVSFESFVVGIIFLVAYLILSLCFLNKKYNKLVVSSVFIFLVCFEAFINMYSTSITTVTRSEYIKKFNATKILNRYVDDMTKDFYRIEMDKRKSKDDGALYNYPSASIFSSSCYKEGMDFYEKMGMEASMNAYSITGSTPFMDSFLNVKYTYFDDSVPYAKELNMRELKKEDDLYLYENIDVLPLSFVLNDDFIEKYDFGTGNPATAQNNFARSYNKKILLEPISIDTDGIQSNFTVNEDGDYYAFVLDKSIDEVNYQYKNTSKKFEHTKRGYFLELGYLEKGETCGLRNDTNERDIQIQVFRFRFDNMKALIDRIKDDSKYDMKAYDETHISYTLDAKVKGKAMISLPYDEGWTIRVDGVEVEKEAIFDCFLGFNVDKGVHNIELSYMPKGLMIGIILSLLGIFMYIFYNIYLNRLDNYKKS